MKPTDRPPLGERLKRSLEEGIEFARGERDLRVTVVPPARTYTGNEVAAIRTRRRLSQAQFARLLAVSPRTLQSWEQGVRRPSRPAMRLLQVFDDPEAFGTLVRTST
jgi:putative transcriptional regulator